MNCKKLQFLACHMSAEQLRYVEKLLDDAHGNKNKGAGDLARKTITIMTHAVEGDAPPNYLALPEDRLKLETCYTGVKIIEEPPTNWVLESILYGGLTSKP